MSSRLLIAASGTGGHLFPAIAIAEQLTDYDIEWLGVPDRLETKLVPAQYPLHTIHVSGFQGRPGLSTLRTLSQFVQGIRTVRRLITDRHYDAVLTTGGYIAAPAIIAARWLGKPAILHESNAMPGRVTRWLSPWCSTVAIGFEAAAQYLPKAHVACVGTPVRSAFLQAIAADTSPALPDLDIPAQVPLIVVVGGSQGAVAVNQLVRQAALAWFDAGAWVVHLTGDHDPDIHQLQHPQYITRPFYEHMAALLQRADLAVSRAGAGTLTELAVSQTPAILIPYPFAADDHQTYNAAIFAAAGAAQVCRQRDLTPELLQAKVLHLLQSPRILTDMKTAIAKLAITDSAAQIAQILHEAIATPHR